MAGSYTDSLPTHIFNGGYNGSVMHKRLLHHYFALLRPLNYWYFLVAFFISLTISVVALRQNNIEAIHLRNRVLAVDQQNGDVESALRSLRLYIYGHMNTNLATPNGVYPPIQLKYRYDRLVQVEKDRVNSVNSQVYTDAQHICEQLYPHSLSGGPRVPCIQDYVTKNGAKEQPIPDSLYKFAFIPPFWSPDFAGWSLVVSALLLLLFVVRYSLDRWFKYNFQSHN